MPVLSPAVQHSCAAINQQPAPCRSSSSASVLWLPAVCFPSLSYLVLEVLAVTLSSVTLMLSVVLKKKTIQNTTSKHPFLAKNNLRAQSSLNAHSGYFRVVFLSKILCASIQKSLFCQQPPLPALLQAGNRPLQKINTSEARAASQPSSATTSVRHKPSR